jgi:hypothetical protein
MTVRGKFVVQKVAKLNWSDTAVEITLGAQYDTSIPEDQKFSKATPSGSLTMLVDNPSASAALELGKAYYIDISPAQ